PVPPHSEADLEAEFHHAWGFYQSTPEGFVIAEDDETGRIIGVAAAGRRPPQWILTNFFVDPAYQGRGIGRKILTQAFAVNQDCTRRCLHASTDPAAQALYMKFWLTPQPYSINFKGRIASKYRRAKHFGAEKASVIDADIIANLNRIDQATLGFERA